MKDKIEKIEKRSNKKEEARSIEKENKRASVEGQNPTEAPTEYPESSKGYYGIDQNPYTKITSPKKQKK